jgi:hypothetical protein
VSEPIVVECKRYARSRKVGVRVVRELLGVQLHLGVPRGRIVATCEFTSPAVSMADDVRKGNSGYQMDLVDIYLLLRELGCYNVILPPLDQDPRFRVG